MKRFLIVLLFLLSFVIVCSLGAIKEPTGFRGYIYGHGSEFPYCYALFYNSEVSILVHVISMKNSSVEEITTILANERYAKPQLLHKNKEVYGKIEFKESRKDWVYYIARNKANRYFVITVIYEASAKSKWSKTIESWILKQDWRSL